MSQPNRNLHYKMYKQGRFWVFASMTLLTLQLAQSTAQADTVDAPSTTTSDTTDINTDYQDSTTVPIGQPKNVSGSNSDQPTSSSTTTTSISKKTSLPDHDIDDAKDDIDTTESNPVSENTNDGSSPETVTADTVVDQVAPAKDAPKTDATPAIDAATPKTGTEDEDASPQPTPPDITEPPADNKVMTTPDTATVRDVQEVDTNIPKHTTEIKWEITKEATSPQSIKLSSRSLKAAAPVVNYPGFYDATNLNSGIYGTCEWWVDQDGVLHLGAGTLPATEISSRVDDNGIPTTGTIPWAGDTSGGYNDSPIKSITLEGKVSTDADASGLFYGLKSVTSIKNFDYLDTSQATDLSYLFFGMYALQQLDASHLDTAQVTRMNNMFNWDLALTKLNVSNFDTSNVTNMANMFTNCQNLKSLDLTNFVTDNVTNMSAMFFSCMSLTALDLSSFNTSNVTDMSGIFYYDGSLSQLDLSTFDMRKVLTDRLNIPSFAYLLNLNMLKLNANVRFILPDGSNAALGEAPDDTLIFTDEWTNTTTHQTHTAAELMALYGQDSTIDQTYTYTRHKWVAAKDLTLYIGPKTSWSNTDNLTSHQATTGENITIDQLTPILLDEDGHEQATVDLTVPNRTYTITYHDTINPLPNDVVAKITVLNSAAKIIGQDSVITLGSSWKPTDNFINAVDVDGQTPVDFSQMSVTNNVNPNQLGTYTVTYSFIDQAGNVVPMTQLTRRTASSTGFKVVVAGIQLSNPTWTVRTTDDWQPNANLEQAVDQNGQDVTSQVTIQCRNQAGQSVTKLTKPGTYTVTYSYPGLPTATTTVTVTTGATLNVKNTSLQLGTTWDPQANFINATDVNGQAIGFEQLTYQKDAVNTQQPGQYQVAYTYTDSVGNPLTKIATITVLAPVMIDAKDSTLNLGDSWQPAANFISASDEQGQAIPLTQVQVSTTGVNTAKAGQYHVTYTYTSTTGNQATKTVTITVLAPIIIHVKDSTLNLGDTWQPADNFISASNEQGQAVSFKQVTVITTGVDTSKAGQYQVTYTYGTASQTITVTVNAATIEPKPDQPEPEKPDSNQPDTNVPDETVSEPSLPEQSVVTKPTNQVKTKPTTQPVTPNSPIDHQQQVAVPTTGQVQLALPKKVETSADQLPQTNADTRSTTTVTGMLILALSSLIALLGRYLKARQH